MANLVSVLAESRLPGGCRGPTGLARSGPGNRAKTRQVSSSLPEEAPTPPGGPRAQGARWGPEGAWWGEALGWEAYVADSIVAPYTLNQNNAYGRPEQIRENGP